MRQLAPHGHPPDAAPLPFAVALGVRELAPQSTLDEDAHRVWLAGDLVALSPTEFRLLRYLIMNAERVVSKSQILSHVWGYDYDGDPGVVETYVFYLRRKLGDAGTLLIHTVRGVGYTLRIE